MHQNINLDPLPTILHFLIYARLLIITPVHHVLRYLHGLKLLLLPVWKSPCYISASQSISGYPHPRLQKLTLKFSGAKFTSE
ncbi:MAG: hypothetical protein LUH20_11740, partial [Lachnospiraceae bacterium]|nr:hypothetical protein [Lachnospiraceae bacterium]